MAAVWIGPRLISWEGQRNRLAALAAERLGRPVALQGPLRVVLLPQPVIEADEVHLGQDEGGLGVKAQTLRLRLGLAPLLFGRLEARDLVLIGADIRLPWPLPGTGALRPAPWLSDFAARIEASRVTLGEAVLENVAARLAAPGPLDAVRVEGSFTRAGAEARFQAVLGRPGYDGVGTLELRLNGQGASLLARGALVAEGGFEGRVEASGAYLSAFLPAPALPFRATGRLRATEHQIAASDLAVEFDGASGRAAADFTMVPQPRLDLALNMSRLDLDTWSKALRHAAPSALPVTLDISAEAARWQGQVLRRIKGGLTREGKRLTLTDVSALLPGDAEMQAHGTAQDDRLDLMVGFSGPSLRASLAALGLPLERLDPARLRSFEGQARILLDPTQFEVQNLVASLDGTGFGGAGILRFGARPALGLGINAEKLDLDGLITENPSWQTVTAALDGVDANLRLTAQQGRVLGIGFEDLVAEARLEAGRLSLRRLTSRAHGAAFSASGGIGLGAQPSLHDVALEFSAPMASTLAGLVSDMPSLPAGIAVLPLTLRLQGNGALEALALRGEMLLEDARLDVQLQLDALKHRAQGSLTFRHPGAARLLGLALGQAEPLWMGEGSVSLIARLAAEGPIITADSFDLVAAETRLSGDGRLDLSAARPRLAGRIQAETLALPGLDLAAQEPLPLWLLTGFDAALTVAATRLEAYRLPPLQDANLDLVLENGRLRLKALQAQLAGGKVEGQGVFDASVQPPRLEGSFGIIGASLAKPIFELPLDLAAGRIDAEGRIAASGHAPAALLATLEGEGRFLLADGVISGLAMAGAYTGAGLADARASETAIREALLGGATAVERLEGGWRIAAGRLSLEEMRLAGEGGLSARISGGVDLPRQVLDLGFALRPPVAEAPDIGLRFSGPASAPLRLPDIAPWVRWRAAQR